MAGPNDPLVALFRELRELVVLDEGSPNAFRARAYENAADAIQTHRGDLSTLSEKELVALGGIGKSTAQKIREYYEKGTISKLEELRKKYPPEFVELSKIPGLGPKTLLRLRAELGVKKLEDLRRAIAKKEIQNLKGLGSKMEEKIRHAIDRLGLTGKERRTPIGAALPLARELVAELESFPEVERALYCGSLRRFRDTIADVDIVAGSKKPGPVMERFVGLPAVAEVIGSGETKTSVLTKKGLQVDLRIVEPNQFGAACQYFTGSKTHNIKLRQLALDRGWILNEYGLSEVETGKVIASRTEEEIYRALGLAFIPPPMREDRGEIELAAEGKLPSPLTLKDVRGDLHVHTSLSGDGRSSLEEILEALADRGYAYAAITEHAEDLAMNGVSREKLRAQRKQIDALRKKHSGMNILHGCELNIGANGSLDYDESFRRELDWTVAGIHSHFELDENKQTERVLKAMEDPTIDAIAHLTGRMIGQRPGVELDFDRVLAKAAETETLIEINSALARLDASSDVLFRARDLPVLFVVNTDTHHVGDLSRMEWGTLQATRGWVDPSRIVNTWPRKKFEKWLTHRKDRRAS